MRLVDLTLPIEFSGDGPRREDYFIPLAVQGRSFKALCHRFAFDGMSGTYLDYPGHAVETDDGDHAGVCPLERLFMLPTTVIHLDRDPADRVVTAAELEGAGVEVRGEALIIHALGAKRSSDFTETTIPYFGPDAVEWIASHDIRLFASDIYENRADLQGIFTELFARGVSCVCQPVNLDRLHETYPRCCVIPARMEGAVQLPCRFFVVEGAA